MDKTQVYCLIIIMFNVVCGVVLDGKPRTGKHRFVYTFIGLLLMMPIFGRVLLNW